MAAAVRTLFFWIFSSVLLISLAMAQDEHQFIYHGFQGVGLQLDRLANIRNDGLLELTNASEFQSGHAFYPSPVRFNINSSDSVSFSTHFVFATVPAAPNIGGNGMAFVISPSMDFNHAIPSANLGLFNISNNGLSSNCILAIELDTVESIEFNDIDGNHVGIDVNGLISNDSATAAYFSDEERRNITLDLSSGDPIRIWIDYNGAEQLLNVTLAPITIFAKPNRPLLSTSIDLSQILIESMYVGFSQGTGTRVSGHYVLGWSFNGDEQAQNLDVLNHLPPPPPLPPPPRRSREKLYQIVIVALVAGAVVLITIGATVYVVQKKRYGEVCEDWEKEYGPQRISYKNLYKAAKGFKDNEVLLGRGGFGKVYKGVLPHTNEHTAVKKITHDTKEGMNEFVSEIVCMGRLSHRNLVQLRSYCRRKGELLLVYEYMPNGSLEKFLYDDTKPYLNWFQRYKIIRGVATGLLYLHEEWEQVVLHRDVKPANILLDADLNGKLGDFGLARLYDRRFKTTSLVGTIGYLAPELIRTGVANTSTDVYAFGVSMLEIVCGRRPKEPGMVDLVDWVIVCWERGNILEACDDSLEGIYVEDQMELILKLGLFCTHNNPAARPSMRELIQYLDGDARLPESQSDDSVVGSFNQNNKASVSVLSESSMPMSSSYTVSTVDSILIIGR